MQPEACFLGSGPLVVDLEGLMNRRISRFSIHRTSASIGLMYGLLGLLAVPVFVLAPSSERGPERFAIALPVLFGILGYAMVAVYCVVYNLVARWTGGIEFTVEEEADNRAV